ncbi:RecQ family ATP-dependent DNA helicase [Cesiribacter andamanensis]|uniref:ATP-dependent DNA helicase RecQ n=1 Tax=Cesiribacter andamanensis AMV16 TaxID=1279009 RepID=M7NNT1_9BACT|nr:ATP-dependent DNA helicase RecQ [Cesiribacter andamanensis]EMR03375.1 ATP-dependent DNA helicase recQ [Cesiribacter andamanensis AMV16]
MQPTPHHILQHYWGYTQFRPLQEDIIAAVLQKKDVLALMPTGGGKSLCFQVPALLQEGVCLVITPLIALMKDQVEHLKARGIPAEAVYSGMSKREIDVALDNCVYGSPKFLYLSPERLQTELLQERVKRMTINLLAVDEAHCISQWGYDFRPAYLKIAEFRQLIPGVPCIALTATATQQVAKDIQEKLEFGHKGVLLQKSFARENLSYSVRWEENKPAKLLEILRKVPGTAVIYLRSRKQTQLVAKTLRQYGISADHYHAGLQHEERVRRQDAWMQGKLRVVVATNAFGMGIDKSDVRLVVHLGLPDTLEAYYQEAGRAGRDGKKAYAVVLVDQQDVDGLRERIRQEFPEPEVLRHTYQALANYYKLAIGSSQFSSYDFELDDFARTYSLEPNQTWHALKKLEEQGFIQLSEAFFAPSRLHVLLSQQELYAFQIANAGMEPLLKNLLRIYGGEIFSGYTRISENELARQTKWSVNQVRQQLDSLQKMDVIAYEPQRDKPQLTFLTPRHDAAKLPLQLRQLEERKTISLQKAEAVIDYAEQELICRTRYLLDYFGELDYEKCGICDLCLLHRGEGQHDEKVFRYRQQIRTAISLKPHSLPELEKALDAHAANKNILLHTVRLMIDEGSLKYTETGALTLSN